MATSKILNDLLSGSRADVEADLARVYSERQRLQKEEQFLQAVLGLFDAKDPMDAQAPSKPKTSTEKLTAKDHILAVMRPRGYEPWPIPRVIGAVQSRDPEVQPPAIRLALRRLHAEGILMRDSHKNYRLDPEYNPPITITDYEVAAKYGMPVPAGTPRSDPSER
jgi:hypothetical protein